jgi:hypothetical protein
MFNRKTFKRALLAAVLCAASLGASAAQASYSFDFSQDSLTKYNDVSFVNAVYADILDSEFVVSGQHWIEDKEPGALAVTIESMSKYEQNGTAAAGVTALQALWSPVLMRFAAPVSIASFVLKQDDSAYGFPGQVNLTFLNSNGQQVGNGVDYVQNSLSTISSGAVKGDVSSVLLSSGKFYKGIDVMTAVPEPETYAMLLAGLALLGLAARRRRR